MKKISILGSTGSIGTNCLNVIGPKRDQFEVAYLTTYQNAELLLEQALKFNPRAVAIFDESKARNYTPRFKELGIEVYVGFEGILEISAREDVDIVVNALVGAIGLQPTLNALQKGHRIALANKETLVLGGKLVMQKAKEVGADVIPIDSEHSALLQCLVGEKRQDVQKIVLTASGGPFRERKASDFRNVTVKEALDHPNWNMGPKVTIDSATLMNKGLEVIEAFWLFDLELQEIEIIVHPQSIIHSFVEFRDCSIKAQLGLPDMRVPIQYALTYPERLPAQFPRLEFSKLRELRFEEPDFEKFRCLDLAFQALRTGGGAPAVLNAANEEAVALFLSHKIRFDQVPALVEDALSNCEFNSYNSVDDLLEYDRSARAHVASRQKTMV